MSFGQNPSMLVVLVLVLVVSAASALALEELDQSKSAQTMLVDKVLSVTTNGRFLLFHLHRPHENQIIIALRQEAQFIYQEFSASANERTNLTEHEEIPEPGIPGAQKPLVMYVDSFHNMAFCSYGTEPVSDSDCLVIVWIDIRNKLVEFASINFNLEFNQGQTGYLFARVIGHLDVNDNWRHHVDLGWSEIALDRTRLKVYINLLVDGAQHILSAQFEPKQQSLIKLASRPIESCPGDETRIDYLSVDPHGSWLFTSVRYLIAGLNATRLIAIKMDDELDTADEGLRQATIGVLVNESTSRIALDAKRRQLVWMNKAGHLRKCRYATCDSQIETIGVFSSPDAMKFTDLSRTLIDENDFLFSTAAGQIIDYNMKYKSNSNRQYDSHPSSMEGQLHYPVLKFRYIARNVVPLRDISGRGVPKEKHNECASVFQRLRWLMSDARSQHDDYQKLDRLVEEQFNECNCPLAGRVLFGIALTGMLVGFVAVVLLISLRRQKTKGKPCQMCESVPLNTLNPRDGYLTRVA